MDMTQKVVAIFALAVMPIAFAAWDKGTFEFEASAASRWIVTDSTQDKPKRLLPPAIADIALNPATLFSKSDTIARPLFSPIDPYIDTSQRSDSFSGNGLVAVAVTARRVNSLSQYEQMEFKQTWGTDALLATRTVRF